MKLENELKEVIRDMIDVLETKHRYNTEAAILVSSGELFIHSEDEFEIEEIMAWMNQCGKIFIENHKS